MYQEIYPIMEPDALRKYLLSMRNFFGMYTKMNNQYEDLLGLQYFGTVNNFGSEIFVETRKLATNRPPIKTVLSNDKLSYYFDISYSDMITTYDQQNTLVGFIRKNVFIENKEYRLKFTDCTTVSVIRSASWSDPEVYRENFACTTTPPMLIIHDITGETEDVQISLKLNNDTDNKYYFPINKISEIYVNKYENGTLITNTLNDTDQQLPLIWITSDKLRLMSDLQAENNTDYINRPLLTVGTDGHNNTRLYPMVYGEDNVPSISVDNPGLLGWYLQVIPVEGEMFTTSGNLERNYDVHIAEIRFVNAQIVGFVPWYSQTIKFNSPFVSVKLNRTMCLDKWVFRTPTGYESDFAGKYYEHLPYGYINLFHYNINMHPNEVDSVPRYQMMPAFDIHFNNTYLNPYEYMCGNNYSGIHLDSNAAWMDNGIPKKNGIVHELSEFDGIPRYFSNNILKETDRSHVELYTMRDRLNKIGQPVMNKQMSALIIDTGVYPNTVNIKVEDLPTIISYDLNTTRKYVSNNVELNPISNNYLSDITYNSDELFGDYNSPHQYDKPRFIYHGKRQFSLNIMGLDPNLEYSRGYYLNNDPAVYENNSNTDMTKCERTICRIADIPTSFVQLMNVEGVAPTLVIDKLYVRQGVSYNNIDEEMLMNDKNSRMVKLNNDTVNGRLPIYPEDFNFNEIFNTEYLIENGYVNKINLNRSLDMTHPTIQVTSYQFSVSNGGSSYAVDDRFTIIIGGIYFTGIIKSVDSGIVKQVSFVDDADAVINISNFQSANIVYPTTTISGEGSNLEIILNISTNVWDSLQPKISSIYDNLYSLKLDTMNNVWVWEYDITNNEWVKVKQLSGTHIVYNYYDTEDTRLERTLNSSILYNEFTDKKTVLNIYDITTSITLSDSNISKLENIDIDSKTDYSSYIINHNKQNALYCIKDIPSVSQNNYSLIQYETNPDASRYTLPQCHLLNLSDYKFNELTYMFNGNTQPTVCYFDPTCTVVEKLNKVGKDQYEYLGDKDITFVDVIKPVTDVSDVLDINTGTLNANVYQYDEFSKTPDIINLETVLASMDHAALVNKILTMNPEAYPLWYENTEYRFSDEMLRNYIITNSYDSKSVYNKNGITLLREKGDKVVDYVNGEYNAIGKQPMGCYRDISSERYDVESKINGNTINLEMLNIFKLNKQSGLTSLDGFKLYDECDNDISNKVLLIYDNKRYINIDNKWVEVI